MATVDPATPTDPPFQSQEPVVEFWDTTSSTPEWKEFQLGEMWMDNLTWRVMNAGISDATLRYECGLIAFDGNIPVNVQPLDLDRTWVRTTVFGDGGNFFSWVGLVVGTQEVNRAQTTIDSQLITQRFQVRGPEWLLSRIQIVQSVAATPSGQQLLINSGLTYNASENTLQGQQVVKGNKTPTDDNRFYGARDADIWPGDVIANNLQLYFPSGPWEQPWTIEGTDRLEWLVPVLKTHGRSLFDVLTDLVSYQRGLAVWLDYQVGLNQTDFGTITVKIDSQFEKSIELPSQQSVPGNANVVNVSASTSRAAMTTIVRDTRRRVEKVVAQGARRGAVVTYSLDDNSLEEGWFRGDEPEYAAGDPDAAAQPDISVKQRLNDRFRRITYPDLFNRFHVPLDWNGEVRDLNGRIRQPFQSDLYIPDMRFATYIPLKIGYDYTSGEPRATSSAPDVDEFLRPFALIETNDGWENAELLSVGMDETQGRNGFEFSCRVRPLDRRMGMLVSPSTVNHAIAINVPSVVQPNSSAHEAELDYTKMLITAYAQAHEYAQAQWPDVDDVAPEDIHYLRLGDTAFQDFMPNGTIVGVQGGNLIQAGLDMFVRDDTQYLEDTARMAFAWYGRDRVAADLSYQAIAANLQPGYFVRDLDNVSANSLVSSVSYDFRQQTTRIGLDFVEPDFLQLAGGPQ